MINLFKGDGEEINKCHTGGFFCFVLVITAGFPWGRRDMGSRYPPSTDLSNAMVGESLSGGRSVKL